MTHSSAPSSSADHETSVEFPADAETVRMPDDAGRGLPDETRDGVLRWLLTGDVGLSSRAMAAHLLGHRIGDHYDRTFHPLDGYDFSRCVALLDSAPGLRSHLPELKGLSPVWAALVDRWDEIETFYRKERDLDQRPSMTTAFISLVERIAASQSTGSRRAA